MAVSDIVSFAVIGFFAVRLFGGARAARRGPGRSLVREVVANVRWRHVWPVPVLLTAVIATASVLMLMPGLDWGWWSALGGEGNPVFGSSETTSGTAAEWLLPLVLMALLVPALPLFAHAEERIFRQGAETWSRPRRALKTLQFGLVHALVGIPIGAALALSLGGAWFMVVYLREYRATRSTRRATIESTTAHTVYNGCIIAIVVVALVWTALTSSLP